MEQYILCGSIFGGVMSLVWWAAQFFRQDDDAKLRERLRGSFVLAETGESGVERFKDFIARMGQAAGKPFIPKSAEKQSALRRQMAYAGIYSPAAIRTFAAFKMLLLIGGLAGGYTVGLVLGNATLGVSAGGLLGYMLPGTWLSRQIRIHQKCIDRGLPDALDLMVVCVEAGLTIDAAMQRVSHELVLAHPRLAKELEITHMETRVGVARADALKNFAQRTGSPGIGSLATMLIQAERFGTSISQSLRIQADTLRTERQHKAEELAAKASVKLSFPVVLFIFPAVLIVLAGPAAIGLIKSALFSD